MCQDSSFPAEIEGQDGTWIDWFTWEEEGTDWRRTADCKGFRLPVAAPSVKRSHKYGHKKATKERCEEEEGKGEVESYGDAKADEIIRNTYRTLMSRGMKGCYVYFTDEATASYFKDLLPT
jgi:hypothetical protein